MIVDEAFPSFKNGRRGRFVSLCLSVSLHGRRRSAARANRPRLTRPFIQPPIPTRADFIAATSPRTTPSAFSREFLPVPVRRGGGGAGGEGVRRGCGARPGRLCCACGAANDRGVAACQICGEPMRDTISHLARLSVTTERVLFSENSPRICAEPPVPAIPGGDASLSEMAHLKLQAGACV